MNRLDYRRGGESEARDEPTPSEVEVSREKKDRLFPIMRTYVYRGEWRLAKFGARAADFGGNYLFERIMGKSVANIAFSFGLVRITAKGKARILLRQEP